MSTPTPDPTGEAIQRAIPILVVTGFLGAGKTTFINALASRTDLRLALIVNEFGAVGVDGRLLQEAGRVLEIANGCICCVTTGDLRNALREVLDSGYDVDGVVIETSGLADPAPVVALIEEASVSAPVRLVAVVTLVDALNFDDNLDHAEAALQQIVVADVLAISKADLVPPEIPARISAGLHGLNSDAAILSAGELAALDLAGLLARPSPVRAPDDEHTHHSHDSALQSAALTAAGPLDPLRLDAWIEALPASVIRVKGFVRLRDRPQPIVMQVVGRRRSAEPAGQLAEAVPGAELVVIGRDLDLAALERGFSACAAGE